MQFIKSLSAKTLTRCSLIGGLILQVPSLASGAWEDGISEQLQDWHKLESTWTYAAGENWYWLASSGVWVYVVEPAAPVEPLAMVEVQGGTLASSNDLDGTVVASFKIGRYAVTLEQWDSVKTWANANGYTIDAAAGTGCAADHPVVEVNWQDALIWLNAKSEMEGLTPVYYINGEILRSGTLFSEQRIGENGYRLPLEAEWEFAARGGVLTNGYTYAGSDDWDAVGWFWDNGANPTCSTAHGRGTFPVGQKAPNELGLYDMSGNTWEWCFERRQVNNTARSTRGGDFLGSFGNGAVDFRFSFSPSFRSGSIGFRVAQTVAAVP